VPLQAAYANHVWTYDFIEDATRDGRKLRYLIFTDEHNRRGLALQVRRSFKDIDVLAVLQAVFAHYGTPAFLRSDNGPEFIARAVKTWLAGMKVGSHYIDPGSPWQNAFGESFNATLRREHLNREVCTGLGEARVLAKGWLRYYNEQRGHTSLDYKTPVQYFHETAGIDAFLLGALPPSLEFLRFQAAAALAIFVLEVFVPSGRSSWGSSSISLRSNVIRSRHEGRVARFLQRGSGAYAPFRSGPKAFMAASRSAL